MSTLSQRVDRGSISATFLALPKGRKRGRAVGFWRGDPVASVASTGDTAPPYLWIDGKAQLVTFQDVKKVVPLGTSGSQLAGLWYTPKHDERALVWTRSGSDTMAGVELHPTKGWQKSSAAGCGDGQQIGYGCERFPKDPSRALLWTGSSESMVVLTGPDPSRATTGKAVAQGVQVGCVSPNSLSQRACLWRGTSASYVDLHPNGVDFMGSDAMGVRDGQQVGAVWGDAMTQRAALWSGSPESYTNLAPNGFVRSTAWTCARGFQVGWAEDKEMGMCAHAILWGGSADEFIDLQEFLPEPWNVSQAMDLDVDGDTLRILGTANQAVMQKGYEVNAAEQPVIWTIRLLEPEAPARREMPPVIEVPAPAPEEGDERRTERAVARFAKAMIDDDYKAAHELLAPWLAKQVTPQQLKTILVGQFFADAKPVDFLVTGIDITLDHLREHYREYYKDDATRTLASVESFGEWGPPSIHIDEQITPENFREWMSIDLTPQLDDASGLDYLLRLYFILVDIEGEAKIGYLEPSQ
jgi:hypothetical protein